MQMDIPLFKVRWFSVSPFKTKYEYCNMRPFRDQSESSYVLKFGALSKFGQGMRDEMSHVHAPVFTYIATLSVELRSYEWLQMLASSRCYWQLMILLWLTARRLIRCSSVSRNNRFLIRRRQLSTVSTIQVFIRRYYAVHEHEIFRLLAYKLSCRREAARCFVSLNISLTHARSLPPTKEINAFARVCLSVC